jgi:hypothetical protein
MKLNYFLRSLALIMLMAVVVSVKATDIHVADGGSDAELAAALEQAQTGDVILINGWLSFDAVVHVSKNVTIKAGVEDAGFDGQGLTRLFEIHPEAIDGAKLVFENLGFTGGNGWGSEPADGGVARIYDGGVVEFILCWFDGNSARRGGAFFIGTGDAGAPMVTFKGCEATNNIAQGDGGESRGGYLFIDGEGVSLNHEYCKINSSQSIGGRGGALCLFGNNTRRFYYCMFSNNKGGNWGPDPAGDPEVDVKLDKDGNPVSEGEYEGGLAFITGGATIFESCAIVGNKSWSHSGIIRGWGNTNTTVTFVNTALTKNQSLHDRSPLWIGGDATYTFVNSLFVENIGQNQGNGAGFDFDGAGVRLNIFNSVFARNMAGTDGAVDIRNAPNYAVQLTVKNSLIGFIQGDESVVTPVDNPSISAKSDIAMYKLVSTATAATPEEVASLESSGVDFASGVRYSKSFGMPYYLLAANSKVTKLGDPALLGEYDLNTDIFGNTHPVAADGSITAAPTVATVTNEWDDSGWENNLTGIFSPKVSLAKDNIRIIGTVSNGILGVDFGNIKGQTEGDLISLTGHVVENVFDTMVVSKGYYNVNVRPGIYLLRVVNGGNTYVQKVIVK